MENLAELEKMYQECAMGKAFPNFIVLWCEECRKEFIITTKFKPELCEHLQKVLSETHVIQHKKQKTQDAEVERKVE